MKFKKEIEEVLSMEKPPQNIAVAKFEGGEVLKGDEIWYPSFISLAGKVFAEDLLNYAKAGGDMKNINACNVFSSTIDNKHGEL